MPEWTIRNLATCSPEDVEAYHSVAGESLQYFDSSIWETYIRRIGLENVRCIWDGERYIGGLAFYRTAQWYGGKPVPCAGVSGVAIDPAARGNGACQALLSALLNELHSEKMAMASLYASTQRLYRSVGFEQSGHRYTYSLPMNSLKAIPAARSMRVERNTQPSWELLSELAVRRNRSSQGGLQRTAGMWERIVFPVNATTSTYFLGGVQTPQGFITLQHGVRAAGYPQPLVATDWVANSPAALQRMIALILDHRSMCDRFQWNGGPQDPLLLAAEEGRVDVLTHLRTLNRIVCLQQALTGRGYPTAVCGELHLDIADELLPANAGRWILEVDQGRACVRRGGEGCLRMHVRGLVPLFTSLLTCRQLVLDGQVEATEESQIELANLMFAGPAPWTSEIF